MAAFSGSSECVRLDWLTIFVCNFDFLTFFAVVEQILKEWKLYHEGMGIVSGSQEIHQVAVRKCKEPSFQHLHKSIMSWSVSNEIL